MAARPLPIVLAGCLLALSSLVPLRAQDDRNADQAKAAQQLAEKAAALVRQLDDFGISGLANIVASIKLARHFELGRDDVVMTVATDGAAMYETERRSYEERRYPDGFDEVNAGEAAGRHLDAITNDHVLELSHVERTRIFNLGYFTWVEQQGIALADFERRRSQRFWTDLHGLVPLWDELITAFNRDSGMADAM